jgi:hypothetical protein
VNLAATRYPWVDQSVAVVPTGPITVVLGLRDVRGELDIYGVPQFEPQSYSDRIVAVAVRTDAGWLDDPAAWFRHTAGEIQRAHLALFRTIAGWDAEARFKAGARSYVAMFEPALEIAGATPADVRRLLLDPLDAAVTEWLPAHLDRAGPAALWRWAAERGDRTIFAPVVERLS